MYFKINGVYWALVFVSPHSPVLFNGIEYTLGVTVLEDRSIYLANNLYGIQLHHVLAHELFHAEMLSRGIHVDPYIEECLADLIADHAIEIFDMTESAHENLCRFYNKC